MWPTEISAQITVGHPGSSTWPDLSPGIACTSPVSHLLSLTWLHMYYHNYFFTILYQPGIVVHTCNPSLREADTDRWGSLAPSLDW